MKDGSFTLTNGVSMPAVGFGTWQISPDNVAEKTVSSALDIGYRHIDTAKIYSNEQGVGRAIATSGIPRAELFITTKLWNDEHAYDAAHAALQASLERLGLDYIDLYLIHWPRPTDAEDAWPALVDLYTSGKAKAIGVSNYDVAELQAVLAATNVPPMVNQIEFHPFNYQEQKDIVDFCASQGIVVEAYSPLRQHSVAGSQEIEAIAERYGKTPSQVVLRWCLQHGTAPLPRSSSLEHMRENIDIFDFELDGDAMQTMDELS